MTADRLNGTFPGMKMHAPVAIVLAVLHVALVSGAGHLHDPKEHARQHRLAIVDLPEHLHEHDFGLNGWEPEEPGFDGACIGCRLERSIPALSFRVESPDAPDADLAGASPAPIVIVASIPQPPARAPPAV